MLEIAIVASYSIRFSIMIMHNNNNKVNSLLLFIISLNEHQNNKWCFSSLLLLIIIIIQPIFFCNYSKQQGRRMMTMAEHCNSCQPIRRAFSSSVYLHDVLSSAYKVVCFLFFKKTDNKNGKCRPQSSENGFAISFHHCCC